MKPRNHVNYTHSNNGTSTLATVRSEVQLIVLLTEQLSLFLHEPTVHEWHMAVRIGTDEMIWTPGLIQCRYERTSVDISITHSHFTQHTFKVARAILPIIH